MYNLKNIAILGGAFDPPTIGHLKTAEFVLENTNMDEVLFMPCYSHMFGKEMAKPFRRIEMCEILTKDNPKINVSDFEIKNKLEEPTYEILKKYINRGYKYHPNFKNTDLGKFILNHKPESVSKEISEFYTEYHINKFSYYYIIGMDNANNFDKWYKSEELKSLISFIVVPRKGVVQNEKWFMEEPHIYIDEDNTIPETSSTEAKSNLNKKEVFNFITTEIYEYIKNNELYTS